MSEDGGGSFLLGKMGSMGETAATLGASPSSAKQPDSHTSDLSHNRNEHLSVLFYYLFFCLSKCGAENWRLGDGCHQCEAEAECMCHKCNCHKCSTCTKFHLHQMVVLVRKTPTYFFALETPVLGGCGPCFALGVQLSNRKINHFILYCPSYSCTTCPIYHSHDGFVLQSILLLLHLGVTYMPPFFHIFYMTARSVLSGKSSGEIQKRDQLRLHRYFALEELLQAWQ